MILKLTTNCKASIWVNLSRILQMTLIDAQDGYPLRICSDVFSIAIDYRALWGRQLSGQS